MPELHLSPNPNAVPPSLADARELVLEYGWNATAYQIVNPGIAHWFAERGDAVIGYVERGLTSVVAGAPVCPPSRLEAGVAEFEQATARKGRRVCYFRAEQRLELLLRGRRTP